MEEIGLIIIIAISIFLVLGGYYLDYKKDKSQFVFKFEWKDIKQFIFFVIVAFFFIGGWEKLHRMIFPIKTEYGINHNPEREKLHIPLIKNEWKEVPAMGNQFRKWYTSPQSYDGDGHTKKMIEFGYFGALKEHDFFEDTTTNEVYFITHDYELNQKKYFRLHGGKHAALFIDNGILIPKEEFLDKTKNISK